MAVPKTWTTNEVLTAADLNASLASTAWTAVTYTNSWVDYAAGYQTVQYRKYGDMVQVRGVMKSGTMSTAAFTLPSGFRPPTTFIYVSGSNSAFAQADVQSGGAVIPTVGSNVNFTFNLAFSVTA